MTCRNPVLAVIALVLGALVPPTVAADPPPGDAPKKKPSEFSEMLVSILVNGSNMSPTSGWFHPSQSRYGWKWLAERFDANNDGVITANDLKGSASLFRALDRDHDGSVTNEDLDWTPRSRFLQGRAQARGRFARMDSNGNGRVSLEEWEKAFSQAAKGKKYLTPDDIADLLYPAPPTTQTAKSGRPAPPDGPSRWTLLKGLFSGEIGSPCEGPSVGQEAPAFTLETHDKSRRISLADYRGKKPVVLIFGSFT
jgi:Ca2+-binding EF-hand superfamily protein